MKTLILMALLIAATGGLFAQSSAIHGKVFDENGNPLYAVNVSVNVGGSIVGSTTDFDGVFKLKPLNAGTYTVDISYVGYRSVQKTDVKVYNNQITFMSDVRLTVNAEIIDPGIVITAEREPMIKKDNPSVIPVPSATIIKMPGAKNPVMVARNISSDIQVVENKMVVRGSRPGSSSVYIDGIKVRDEMTSLPTMAIGSMELYTGGIPAKYGDVTGGVIMMTSKSYFDLYNEYMALESRTQNF
ncbi:MAG: carboxypeptidase-like regulatory domain-containing protein [Bacteroidales bacterium]|nr:carboxypeptidase-like regulatory domain-containing protein [Bacteroidales bacterium]